MMGLAFLSIFFADIIMGWVGTLYESMTLVAFWMLDAGIAVVGVVLVVAIGRPLTRALAAPH